MKYLEHPEKKNHMRWGYAAEPEQRLYAKCGCGCGEPIYPGEAMLELDGRMYCREHWVEALSDRLEDDPEALAEWMGLEVRRAPLAPEEE